MKHFIGAVFGALLVGTIWFTVSQVAAQGGGGLPTPPGVPDQVHVLIRVNKSVGDNLPRCMEYEEFDAGQGACLKHLLYSARPGMRKPGRSNYDIWTRYKGEFYHAHAWRIDIGPNWLWIVDGSRIWLRLLKQWSVRVAGVSPPFAWQEFRDDEEFCGNMAPKVLVNQTTDAGTLRPLPPTVTVSCSYPEAGPNDSGADFCNITSEPNAWPDGAIVNCAEAYWELANRYGGRQTGNWSYEPGEEIGGRPWQGAVPKGIPARTWETPDARVFKMCTKVPIGTPCP